MIKTGGNIYSEIKTINDRIVDLNISISELQDADIKRGNYSLGLLQAELDHLKNEVRSLCDTKYDLVINKPVVFGEDENGNKVS